VDWSEAGEAAEADPATPDRHERRQCQQQQWPSGRPRAPRLSAGFVPLRPSCVYGS
jgi:hypothetical protein